MPVRFQRRPAASASSYPTGAGSCSAPQPQPNGTLSGIYTPVSEIGNAKNISKSYVSGIIRLALLAPVIVYAILVGSTDQALMLERLQQPLPPGWEEQHDRFR
jgi:hypothetical protein